MVLWDLMEINRSLVSAINNELMHIITQTICKML